MILELSPLRLHRRLSDGPPGAPGRLAAGELHRQLISNLLQHFLHGPGHALTPVDLPIPRLFFALLFSAGTSSLLLSAAPLSGMRPDPAV